MPNSTINSKRYHGKPCKHCGGTLRYKSSRNCIECTAKKKDKWYQNNKERATAKTLRWKKDNPKRNSEISRRWRQNNHEKDYEMSRAWRRANLDKHREYCKRWRKNNPDKIRMQGHRRRANQKQVKSEPYDFGAICNHYGNKCLRCGRKDVKLTIDHIVPISRNGDDIASNIQPLCLACNSGKRDKSIDYRPDAGPLRWIQRKLFG